MPQRPYISVLLATHNRAEDLRRTLAAMERVDRGALAVEIVIIDNGTDAATHACLRAFDGRLPLRVLKESRPGKSFALNRALGEGALGDVVVFTDDDIDPDPQWLQELAASCRRWPECVAFGGRIDVVWPDSTPDWALNTAIRSWAFSSHDLGSEERPYTKDALPFGGNFWVRRSVIEAGHRFNESLGPPPNARAMGEDSLFLKTLREQGKEIIYCPKAAVGHRIQASLLTPAGIRERARRFGRQGPHLQGLPRPDLLERSPMLWRMMRIASLVRGYAISALDPFSFASSRRIERSTLGLQIIAYNLESLRLAARESAKPIKASAEPTRAGDAS